MYQTANQPEPGSFRLPDDSAEERNNLLKNYSRYGVEFERGEGSYLYDTEGKEYLDFLCGIAVTSFGHNHPQIKAAVEKQLNSLWHVSNLFESGGQKMLAAKLADASGLDKVFFCNSGTEANEAAIKFARKWGNGNFHIISALGGFHGRTYGSLSASGQFKLWNGFMPLTPGFNYVPYGDIEALEHAYNKHVVAVMLEPIQGESGVVVPPEGYLKKVRQFCDEKGILLIMDEVQTGVGRTGKFFAYQHEEILPDIVTMAKGIANGIPLGAVLCSEKVASVIQPGDHGSTFGGNPLAIAAANAVCDLLDEEILKKVETMGSELTKKISSLKNISVLEVRGKGCMIGIELNENFSAKKIASGLLEEGVLVGTSGDKVLRILPPFTAGDEEIEKFTEALNKVMNNLVA